MRRLLPLAFAGLVLLGACGSDGGSSASSSTTTTTLPGTPADQRIARAGLLQAGDLPGFQPVAASTSEAADLPTLGVGIDACKNFIRAIRVDVVQGRAPGFQRGSNVVNGSDAVYRDATDASAQIDAWRDPEVVTCLQKVYEKGLHKSDFTIVPATAQVAGDEQVAFRVTAPGADPATSTAEIVIARVGRAVFSLNILGTAAESTQVQTTAGPRIVERLRSAGG